MARITYESLFAYLHRLGFEDRSPSRFERVLEHSALGILFAFSMPEDGAVDQPVRAADITSVEFQLQQRGLLTGALATVARQDSMR